MNQIEAIANRMEVLAEANRIVTEMIIAELDGFDSITEPHMDIAVWREVESHGYRLRDVDGGVEGMRNKKARLQTGLSIKTNTINIDNYD